MPRDLILNVERRWFVPIKNGTKDREFRAIKPYWTARLVGSKRSPRKYDRIFIVCAYPKGYPYSCDPDLVEVFPWNGYKIIERERPKDYDEVAHTLNITDEEDFVYAIILEK